MKLLLNFLFLFFFSYVFSVVKKLSFVNLDDLKLSFLRKTIIKFIYGSNKMCLGSDNTVKDNCLKSSIDTPINLFHNGTGSKANKNLHAPKSYDNTSFYVRSLKGFSQGENIPQSNNKDLLQKKFIHNKGYLNNSDSGINNTKIDLFSEGNRSSFESGYTNDTNHATVSYTDMSKPYLNANLNGYRKDADLRLFEPREISDVDINYRKEKIIQNVQQKAPGTALEYTHEIVVPEEGLLDKLKLGFKYTGSKFSNSKSKLESIYIKYYDVSRRHFYWTIWESDRNNFDSYKDFKKSWDPKTKIWKEITSHVKRSIRDEIEDLIRINDPFKNKPITDNKVKNILYNRSPKKRN